MDSTTTAHRSGRRAAEQQEHTGADRRGEERSGRRAGAGPPHTANNTHTHTGSGKQGKPKPNGEEQAEQKTGQGTGHPQPHHTTGGETARSQLARRPDAAGRAGSEAGTVAVAAKQQLVWMLLIAAAGVDEAAAKEAAEARKALPQTV